jgi:hypothetical protein
LTMTWRTWRSRSSCFASLADSLYLYTSI